MNWTFLKELAGLIRREPAFALVVFFQVKGLAIGERRTGLMWQKSGSSNSTDNRSAKEYVKELNRQRFADHSDWRMPTIEELASLLTRRRTNGVYMASIFDSHQTSCWSADKGDSGRDQLEGVWVVNFNQGQILQGTFLIRHTVQGSWGAFAGKNNLNYVKAVRLAE